ncbi:hypothetical protein [Kitasatospora indigofera]|uniref:hypothetical protein n=1 Tax=Kitasatospora indigofera TaxID=67307 RepID=UPI003684EBCD
MSAEEIQDRPPIRKDISDAEVELCGRWMDMHGDDPAAWPADVARAYADSLAHLLSGGQL